MAREIENKIEELLSRSVDTVYPSVAALREKLLSGKKLRVYTGIDPTADYIHLGHTTNFFILRRFHELGHKAIVLVGDFTAMIGDPSDKKAARKRLSKREVLKNLASYKKQIGKVVNFSSKKNPVEFRFNSEWLAKLTFSDIADMASNFTVQHMIERDVFEKRLAEEKPLYLHEFLYPLMQGYDSVALSADVEIGGTDQTFNMLAGRTLLKNYKGKEKMVMTTTLLEHPKTKEKLMSKSLGTGIALSLDAQDMYGKVMSLPDESITQLFVDCTDCSLNEIQSIREELTSGKNPKEIKMRLAKKITVMYHGEAKAKKAEEYFTTLFTKRQIPDHIVWVFVSRGEKMSHAAVLHGVISSNSEFKRKCMEGAVVFTPDDKEGRKVENYNETISESGVLRVGKKILGIKIKTP